MFTVVSELILYMKLKQLWVTCAGLVILETKGGTQKENYVSGETTGCKTSTAA